MNGKRNLTIVMTQLCGLLLLCSGAWAQTLINFDDVPDGTVINTRYAGVTFSKTTGGNIFARSSASAASNPNVVSVNGSGPPFFPHFNTNWGVVVATFSTPQSTVSIDATPVVPNMHATHPSYRPFLEAYEGSTLLGKVLYAGPLPWGGEGPMETLTFTSSSANITRVQFSSQQGPGYAAYGLFDNLRFGPQAPVYGARFQAMDEPYQDQQAYSSATRASLLETLITVSYRISSLKVPAGRDGPRFQTVL